MLAGGRGLAGLGTPAVVVEEGAPILGATGLGRPGHGLQNEANSVGVAPAIGAGFAAHFDGRIVFGAGGAVVEEASGARGRAAPEAYGVVAILHQPVWGDVAFGAIEEAYDGMGKRIRGPGSGNRGQTGLPAHFRQTAPEIHGSLVSPRTPHQFTVFFEGGAGDAGEVAGVEVGVVGDGGRVHSEEEEQGAGS